jgi:hypothetical protein
MRARIRLETRMAKVLFGPSCIRTVNSGKETPRTKVLLSEIIVLLIYIQYILEGFVTLLFYDI